MLMIARVSRQSASLVQLSALAMAPHPGQTSFIFFSIYRLCPVYLCTNPPRADRHHSKETQDPVGDALQPGNSTGTYWFPIVFCWLLFMAYAPLDWLLIRPAAQPADDPGYPGFRFNYLNYPSIIFLSLSPLISGSLQISGFSDLYVSTRPIIL